MAELALIEELVDQKIQRAFARYENERLRKSTNRLMWTVGVLNWIAAITVIVLLLTL